MYNMYNKNLLCFIDCIYFYIEVRDGKYKWVVCDLFCVHVDVTPFIFIYTHIYINIVISSTAMGHWIRAVEFSIK